MNFHLIQILKKETLPSALKTSLWFLKWMIPISFIVSMLEFSGSLVYISKALTPLFGLLGLSGQCALVFVTSIFLNIYSAIAVIATLSLTMREITILAIMCLISHNMIIETIILSKTGSSGIKMVFIRLFSSILGALILNYFLPHEIKTISTIQKTLNESIDFIVFIKEWAIKMAFLSIKVIVFISSIMTLQKILEISGIMEILAKVFSPIMLILGLPRKSSFLWLVSNVIGLAYGSAIIIDQIDKGKITKDENNLLNHHVAVSHSLLEDTLLFMAIGVSAFWITIPRILIAIFIVWMLRFYIFSNKYLNFHII